MGPGMRGLRDHLAATHSGARRRVLGRRHVWTAVATDFLLLVVLFTCALVLGWFVVLQVAFKPRVESMVRVLSAQVVGISASFSALPPDQRPAYLAALNRHGQGLVGAGDPAGKSFGEPVMGIARDITDQVKLSLPQVPVLVRPWPFSELWFRVAAPDGQEAWVVIQAKPFIQALIPMLAGFALVVTAAAGFLVHRARRRLAWLAQALDEVDSGFSVLSRGPGDDMESGSGQGELRRRFSRMTERLAHTRDEQEVMLARLAADLQSRLQGLREAQPRSPQAVEASRCIDAMVSAAGQLDQFALRRAMAPGLATHLNELLMGLSDDKTPNHRHDIHWRLGGLPYAGIPEDDARRLFGHLLDNAFRHGGGEVDVTSGLENSWIVVRVLDRGPGLRGDVMADLGRALRVEEAGPPLQRAALGIGLTVARQIAEVNGGFVQLRPREGGGLQAEVWLPPARLD